MPFLRFLFGLDYFDGGAGVGDIHITIVKILQFLYNLAWQIAADFCFVSTLIR